MQPTLPDAGRPQAIEGEYLAPDPSPASGRNWKAAGTGAVGVAVLVAKFKGLLFALLNLKWLLFAGKFALTGFSFLASIWFYALFFGWKFAFFFVLLIAIHEFGHAVFVRAYGLSAPGIYFLPGLGAFTSFTGATTPYQQAAIAFAGPLFGALGGLACLTAGLLTNEPFWYALAYTAFFLNLFNMIPFGVFDGGRMTAPISPNFWIVGFVIVITAAVAFHWWSPVLLLVVLLSLPKAIAAWRGQVDPTVTAVTPAQRLTITVGYFGLLAFLLACLVFSHVAVPGQSIVST
jgi:Zn-dependent protease